MLDLLEEKSLLIPMVAQHHMVEEPFQVKTQLKLIDQLPMLQDI